MTHWIRYGAVSLLLLAAVGGGAPQQQPAGGRAGGNTEEEDVILPSGKKQRDEILKFEHRQNIKDAAELAELAAQLKTDIEKEDRFVLSMATLKKTDDIERLARRIRARLRH